MQLMDYSHQKVNGVGYAYEMMHESLYDIFEI